MHFALIPGSFVEANTIWRTPRPWHNMRSARSVPVGESAAGRRRQIYCLPAASTLHGFTVERFGQKDPQTGVWNEQLVEDRRAGPAQTAIARLDLAAWYRTLSKRNRKIAGALSRGETTADVARRDALSPGRVSQLRVWLLKHWEQFQGEERLVPCMA